MGPRYVDYGPMALPVGDSGVATDASLQSATLRDDALRLRSILSLDASTARSLHEDGTRSASTPDETTYDTGEAGGEEQLCEEIERLWVNDGAHGAREVRLKLGEAIIPGTWIRIAMYAGDLLVELSSEHGGTRHWLCRAAHRLATDVSARLQRSVRVVVLDGDARQAGVGYAHCGDGGTA